MNRLKFWLYLTLLLCAGAANLIGLSRWLTHRAIAQIDRELSRAVATADARSRLVGAEAAQLAEAVARDPAVLQAFASEGEVRAASAAHSAAQSAQGAGADPARSPLVATSGRGWRTFTVNGSPIQTDPHLDSLLSGAAADAARREGYVVVGDALYYLVAAPAGRGAAVGVGVPVTTAWLQVLRVTAGSDVTLLLDQRKPRGTLSAQESELIANAVRGPAGPVDVGALPSQRASFGIPLPALPLLFASAPAHRAAAVALRGLDGGALVLSQSTGGLLTPVIGYQWVTLVGLVVLLLVGVATALSVTNEQETMVPKDLVAAADRITRRDFTARAPVMAGSLGTVAAALNCAAEAARSAEAARADTESLPAPAREGVAVTAPPSEADAGAPLDLFSAFSSSPGPAEPAATPEFAAMPELLTARAPAPAEGSGTAQETPAVPEQGSTAAAAEQEAATALGTAAAGDSAAPWLTAGAEGSAAMQDRQPAAPAEPAEPASASFMAEPGEPLAAAAQEPEPLPAAEPSGVATGEPRPENGALLRAQEPAGSMFEPLGDTPTSAPHAAARSHFEPAASPEARLDPGPLPEAAAQPAAPPAPPPAFDGDEDHWRVTYDEFLKVREQCGESRQVVPYDRFRQKLQKNRDQLMAKYGCRTVRFQVYVKEGRAALKASPIR